MWCKERGVGIDITSLADPRGGLGERRGPSSLDVGGAWQPQLIHRHSLILSISIVIYSPQSTV